MRRWLLAKPRPHTPNLSLDVLSSGVKRLIGGCIRERLDKEAVGPRRRLLGAAQRQPIDAEQYVEPRAPEGGESLGHVLAKTGAAEAEEDSRGRRDPPRWRGLVDDQPVPAQGLGASLGDELVSLRVGDQRDVNLHLPANGRDEPS